MLECSASVNQPMLVFYNGKYWPVFQSVCKMLNHLGLCVCFFAVRDPRATISMSGDPPFWALQVQSMREACSFWISPSLPITPSSHQRYSVENHLPFLFTIFEVLKQGMLNPASSDLPSCIAYLQL